MTARVAGRTAGLAALALVGFAANSLLCRHALGGGHVDAASFTGIRIVSGAAVLAVLAGPSRLRPFAEAGSWISAASLFAYALAFSIAYLRIGAGVGAFVLFGVVQITMISWGLRAGERPRAVEWAGIALATAGLAGFSLPGAQAPDVAGVACMALAGVAWGAYTLRGRGSRRPLVDTAGNFLRAVPFALLAFLAFAVVSRAIHVTSVGIALASASGAIASGIGYSLWYAALPSLASTQAAALQLAVPVLAASGAAALIGEPVSARVALAGAAIVAGVGMSVASRSRRSGR